MAVAGDELRKDHLSPYARAQHPNLLIAASVAFLFLILEPKHISALNVDIESSERGWLVFILLAAVLYFEFAFFAAARADYHVWRRGLSYQKDHLRALLDESAFTRDAAQLGKEPCGRRGSRGDRTAAEGARGRPAESASDA